MSAVEALDEAARQRGGAASVVRRAMAPMGDPRPEPPTDDAPSPSPPWVESMLAWKPTGRANKPKAEVQHAVRGLIRTGKVGALVAAGGTGKTTLLLILAVCHATGRPFFGQEVMVGTFVLMSNDDPQEDLEAALDEVIRAMRLSVDELKSVAERVRIHSLQGEPGLKTFSTFAAGAVVATGLEELILQAVRGISDLVGLALDTLRQFSGGSSNDEQVVKLTVAGATEIALQTGAYVVLPHHTGKQNYRDGVADMYCGSGSAAIADNCRFVLLLQTTTWSDIESKVQRTGQERGDPLVLVSTRGSLLMKPIEPIFLHRDGFHIGRVEGATLTRDQREDEKDRAILRAVRGGADTKNAVFAIVRGKRAETLMRVDELMARGHIGTQIGTRKFAVSPTGSQLLEPSR